jgi:hypothetical protein
MSRRLALAAIAVAIAIGVAVAVFGSDGSRPLAGDYAGKSSQSLPFRLTVAPDRRTLTLDIRWRCPRRGVKMYRRRSVKIADDGTFSWRGPNTEAIDGGDGDEEREQLRIDGRADGDGRLKGTWHADFAYRNGESYLIESRCSSGPVTFEVGRRGGAPGTDDAGNRVIPLDVKVDKLAVGAGSVWVLGRGRRGQDLMQLDPATGRVVGHTPVRATVGNLIAAGEGAAWVLTFGDGPHNGLTRVDGRTGRVTNVLIATPGPPTPSDPPEVHDMAVGAGGVWLQRGDRVLRVDPQTSRVVATIRIPHSAPQPHQTPCARLEESVSNRQNSLVAVGAGSVWVTSDCGRGASGFGFLLRIDPRTNRVTRRVALRASYTAIAAGSLGVWGATPGPAPYPALPGSKPVRAMPRALHRISVRDGRPDRVTTLPGGAATGLAVSRDAVWATRFGLDNAAPAGVLLRLDASSGRPSTALALEQPYDLAVGEHGVWVIDGFARTLTRVRP